MAGKKTLKIEPDEPIPLDKAAGYFPALRGDRPPCVATLREWIKQGGPNGTKLKGFRLGGRLLTTPRACEAFLQSFQDVATK